MNIEYILIILSVIFVSMTFHEVMHAYASYWLGDDTAKLQGRLSLNPIKHIDPFLTVLLPLILALSGLPIFGGAKPVPYNPHNVRWDEWGAALIALAGPITNFLLAFIVFGIWTFVNPSIDSLLYDIFNLAVSVNLGFFVFNMIPIPPLDGSRVLYALAPDFARRIMEYMEQAGVLIILFIVMFAGTTIGLFMMAAINFFYYVFSRIYGV
ncbi:MAG: site-2 protease family protein [Candidatus Saccharimonadaceae bacterium]|nr:site-2 protease family protein [Candidatus Saccharimonadaceae bacterium]